VSRSFQCTKEGTISGIWYRYDANEDTLVMILEEELDQERDEKDAGSYIKIRRTSDYQTIGLKLMEWGQRLGWIARRGIDYEEAIGKFVILVKRQDLIKNPPQMNRGFMF